MAMFTGDKATRKSPIDQFYFVALSLGSLEGRVMVDSARIAMNPDEAGELFKLLKAYLIEVYGDGTGHELCARVWHSMGPVPRREVPRGFIFLAPGYFLIRKEKGEAPPKERQH